MSKLPRNVRLHDRSDRSRAVLTVAGKRSVGPLRDTPREAAEDVAKMRASNRAPSRRLATLADAFSALEAELERTGAKPDTLAFYRNHWRIVTGDEGWSAAWPIADLEPDQVHRYAAKRQAAGVSLGTIWQKEIYALQRAVRVAVKSRLVRADPIAMLDKPRIRSGRFQVMPAALVEDLIESVRNFAGRADDKIRDALLIETVWLSGIRRSEAARLRPKDIEIDAGRMFIDGKTANRYLPLGDRLSEVLTEAMRGIGDTDSVFGTVKRVEHVFGRWKKRLVPTHGVVPLTPHVLRHSFATRAVEVGVQPFQLAALLGHTDIRQTMRYYHASDAAQKAALDAIAGDHGARSGSSRQASRSRRRNASSRRSTDRASTDGSQASTAD